MATIGKGKSTKFNEKEAKELLSLLKSKKDTLVIGGEGSGKFVSADYITAKAQLEKGIVKTNILSAILKSAKIKFADVSPEALCKAVNAL